MSINDNVELFQVSRVMDDQNSLTSISSIYTPKTDSNIE